ncbi:MAG: hypothetical protein A3B37_02960 [Candidatus Sungbacteria bacterium RIFCSPLOWO2_01_FULL_59_16]|uniref:Putative pre-16S rRNA nuclease n=1 Tax=Candidatus Sungbacteria bacterium RIFCSPLOWO2_01_FULL_59_16 TaxID=1802280 RepID=A0A1G2LBE8_9BACT|nr:MAG: hypothetical protein A3B37_02960 [Candidatus Sungbacteria bacterium RIFCSPLOWO2_01_FULL_59_16]
MRYLGIDYGQKRIGLALSDPEGRMAFPRATVQTLGEVAAVLQAAGARRIVVGLPLDARGRFGPPAKAVLRFVADLREKVQLPIALENELLTSALARRHTRREKADASAAALILQSYLDRKNAKIK